MALQSFLGSHIIPQFDLIHNKHGKGQIRCCIKDVSIKGHNANQDSKPLQFVYEEECQGKEKLPQHYPFGG